MIRYDYNPTTKGSVFTPTTIAYRQRWTDEHACAMELRSSSVNKYMMLDESPKSTKRCHWCNSDALALISTQDLKLCVDCGHQMKWRLDEGQTPLM